MRILHRVIIDEKKDLERSNYLLIQGLPGIGLVGLTAAEFLVEEFEHELVFSMIPYDTHPAASTEGESYLASMIGELYVYEITDKSIKRPLLVFTGKRQPEQSIYDTLNALLDMVEGKVTDLVVIGGMTGSVNELGAFTFDESVAEWLKEHGVDPVKVKGHMSITGAVAVFPRLAMMRGIRSRGILSKVSEVTIEGVLEYTTYWDPLASKRAMMLINRIYDLGIPEEKFEYFDAKAEDAKRTYEEIAKAYFGMIAERTRDKAESIHEGEEDKYYLRDRFMSGLKRSVFRLIKELKKTTVRELSSRLDMPYAKVHSIVMRLQNEGFVTAERREVTYLKVTSEGLEALEEGFPEYQLNDGESVEEARARLKDKLPIAIARMKKKGFGKIENGIIRIENRPSIEEDPQYKLLQRIASGNVILESLSDEERKIAEELVRRKMVIKDRRSVVRVELTEKGAETPVEAVEEEEEITQITPELIAKRNEKYEKRVKPYDPKLPVSVPRPGRKHLITILMNKVRTILIGMGFKEILPESPVISAFRNFDVLFVPQNHPARLIHDTFYLSEPKSLEDFPSELAAKVRSAHVGDLLEYYTGRGSRNKNEAVKALLRTHTTAVTIKRLAEHPYKPQRVFVIGRCYRNEKIDATHLAEFFQIDGIIYEEGMTLKHLLGILRDFYYELGFEDIRFRPSYFPFTSPSLEVIGKWEDRRIELGGAGIFRPEVVRPLGINEPVLAFGLGFERLAMLWAKLNDIREVYTSDIEKLSRLPLPKEVVRL